MQKIPGGNIMKTLPLAFIGVAILLASCSSSRYTAASEYDDVYYNPDLGQRKAAVVVDQPAVTSQQVMAAQPIQQEPVYAESQVSDTENLSDYEKYKLQREAEMLGETYEPQGSEALYANQYEEYDSLNQVSEYGQESAPVIINNYYNDPNDYYYSSNLRRFSDDYYGWNYYDPYYTDLYFYTGSRLHWGMSMGWGYPYYRGGYYPSYWGYGGYYDSWYSPWGWGGYYGGYYPYYRSSYWGGYHWGYHHGYWDSHYYGAGHHYHYGRLDNRHYYGYSRPSNVTYGESKGSTYVDPRYRSRTGSTGNTGVTRESATARSSRTNQVQRDGSINRTQRQVRTTTSPTDRRTSAVQTTRTRPPANVQQRSSTNRRGTYTPSYSKPRTSSSSTYNRSTTPSRTYTTPSRSSSRSSSSYNRSSSPSRSSSYSRSSSPSRSSSSYSRPSSSSRSRSTYSRPSSSSRSSSSYSRSSGSSSRSSYSSGRSSSGGSRSSSGSSRSSSGSSRSSSGGSSRSSSSRR